MNVTFFISVKWSGLLYRSTAFHRRLLYSWPRRQLDHCLAAQICQCPRAMPHNPYRVFVSHGSDDSWIAAQIAKCVRGLGADTFLDETSIPKGANFRQIIHQEIASSNEVIALFTPWSAKRSWGWIESKRQRKHTVDRLRSAAASTRMWRPKGTHARSMLRHCDFTTSPAIVAGRNTWLVPISTSSRSREHDLAPRRPSTFSIGLVRSPRTWRINRST